jgi:hypothetical protein
MPPVSGNTSTVPQEPTSTNKRLLAALAYIRRGVAVFPLEENSKEPPYGFRWGQLATTDKRQVMAWWSRHPEWNIGVAAARSGLVIIDEDNKRGKQGTAAFAELRGDNPELDTFTVKTPTGGFHRYLYGELAKSGESLLGEGVDIKSGGGECGGYVVGAGSVIDGKDYAVVDTSAKIARVPDWLASILPPPGTPKDRDAGQVAEGIELDTEEAIKAASEYLASAEGAATDPEVFAVAAAVLDFGLSQETAADLMVELWADRCTPVPKSDWLMSKIRNAWNYRGSAIGSKHPKLVRKREEIADAEIQVSRIYAFLGMAANDNRGDSTTGKNASPIVLPKRDFLYGAELDAVPEQEWLYGRRLARKFLSATIASGGVGKSYLVMAEAMAMATGRNLLGVQPDRPLSVWYYNLEDPKAELVRRFRALRTGFSIDNRDFEGRLSVTSGRESPLVIAEQTASGLKIATPVTDELVRLLREHPTVDVLQVDPFVKTHRGLSENDNAAMDAVLTAWAEVADKANCAIDLVHHARKLGEREKGVTVEASRGASAMVDAVRSARVLNSMSLAEASALGVREDERDRLFRVDDGKANLAPKEKAKWYRLESVWLDNGRGGSRGDNKAIVTPWTPPDHKATVTEDQKQAICNRIDGGVWWASNQSPKGWVGETVAEVLNLNLNIKDDKRIANALVNQWLKDGTLKPGPKAQDEKRKWRPTTVTGRRSVQVADDFGDAPTV